MFEAQSRNFPGTLIVDGFYADCTTLEDMAGYALDRLPHKFSLLGHSMGGRVALEIMRQSPDRVARLALADTGVHRRSRDESEHRYALRDLGRTQGIAALVADWLPPMLSPQNRQNNGLMSQLSAMCIDAGQEVYERQIAALLCRPAVDDVLCVINCPALVIAGELDTWSPPDQHGAIAAKISGSILRVVAGAGHMLPIEDPSKFNHYIAEWLDLPV
jgi:pimeloyl-ACP methyl ester carboxylesterase